MEPSSTARLRLIAVVLSAAASCVDAPPIDMGHERAEDSELPYIAVSDVGFDDLPHDYVDVARSPDKDYCRFVGDPARPLLSCKIYREGWDGDEYAYNSVDDIDVGYDVFPREFGDVNDDGLADYCRFVGSWPDVFLSCNLAGPLNFEADQYGFNSDPGIDLGFSDMPRQLRDRNGDGLLDFCRFVGDRNDPSECCIYANKKTSSFGPNQYLCRSGPLSLVDPPVLIGGGARSTGGGGTKGNPTAQCECTGCGGECGACWGHSCDAVNGCSPRGTCVWDAAQRRNLCVEACAGSSCWKPSDVGQCHQKVELPPFDPKNPFPDED